MAASRKLYAAIAENFKTHRSGAIVFQRHNPGPEADAILAANKALAEDTALALARDNPAFDRRRFLAACGLEV